MSEVIRSISLKAAAFLSLLSSSEELTSPPRPQTPTTPRKSRLYRQSGRSFSSQYSRQQDLESVVCKEHPDGCFDCIVTPATELDGSMDRTTMGEKEESKEKDSKK